MKKVPLLGVSALTLVASLCSAAQINIASVDNDDIKRVKELSSVFLDKHPEITIQWSILDESVLRLRQNRDSKKDNGSYDIYTIGYLQGFNWGAAGRLDPVPELIANRIESGDFLKPVTNGFKIEDNYYALPFYAESSITYYRADRLKQYNLAINAAPTWSEIKQLLADLKQASGGKYGHICLRGKNGWGENVALMTTIANSYGARWYDEQWQSDLQSDAWQNAISAYLALQTNYGISNSWLNGYSENLTNFAQGACDIWVDSTAAGSSVSAALNTDQLGYAFAPSEVTDKGSSWLWSWGFAVSNNSQSKDAAWQFIEWATSEEYQRLVEQTYGIETVPPGTRQSLYDNKTYQAFAPFARVTFDSIVESDMNNQTLLPSPYGGIQFVQTPEFEQVGQFLAKRLSETLEQAVNGQAYDLPKMLKEVSEFADASHRIATYLEREKLDTF